jgi:uncharacterized peroxidase-related enzyme
MPHIDLPEGLPGILGPLAFRPETAPHLLRLADGLLRDDSPLSRGDRELIASYVSSVNECEFCHRSHGSAADWQLDEPLSRAVAADLGSAPVSDKLRALLRLAGQVAVSGRAVTAEVVEAARAEGATDVEIHDTVLIAAAFCMYNRYVDGLATIAPSSDEEYRAMGQMLAAEGYARA